MTTTDDKTEGMPLLKASIMVVLLFQTCALFIRSYTNLQLRAGGITDDVAKDLSWLVVPLILPVLMFPLLRSNWNALKAQFSFNQLTVRLVLISIALGVVLRVAYWGGLITNASFQIFTSSRPGSVIGPVFGFNCPEPAVLLLSIAVTVVMTPLVEETINRGFFLQALVHRKRWQAVLASALLFAVFHRPQSIILASIVGIYLAIQFLNTRTLWACTITHGTYNAAAIFDWSCVHGSWNPVDFNQATDAVGILALALLLASLALAAFLTQEKCYR